MTRALDDGAIARLLDVVDEPDLSGTRYTLVRRLDRGGMGSIWIARDEALDRELALKVVGDLEAPAGTAARLLEEARTLARLEHPGVVPVHDAGTLADGRAYYTMKLVRGERLDRLVAAGLPRSERLALFERVTEAVAFAHARGVIHRDLKPENVMVGGFGEVLVLDFGIAKLRGAAGEVVGTPGYMPPEQLDRDRDVDPRADVFALGATLFFLLTGEPPSRARTLAEAREALGAPPPSARAVAPGVPPALDSITGKAMSRDPEGRYASASALGEDVRRYLAGEPPHAHREGWIERAGRLYARHRPAVLLVAAYVVVRAALILFIRR